MSDPKTEECMYCGKRITLEEYMQGDGVCSECALSFGTISEDF